MRLGIFAYTNKTHCGSIISLCLHIRSSQPPNRSKLVWRDSSLWPRRPAILVYPKMPLPNWLCRLLCFYRSGTAKSTPNFIFLFFAYQLCFYSEDIRESCVLWTSPKKWRTRMAKKWKGKAEMESVMQTGRKGIWHVISQVLRDHLSKFDSSRFSGWSVWICGQTDGPGS